MSDTPSTMLRQIGKDLLGFTLANMVLLGLMVPMLSGPRVYKRRRAAHVVASMALMCGVASCLGCHQRPGQPAARAQPARPGGATLAPAPVQDADQDDPSSSPEVDAATQAARRHVGRAWAVGHTVTHDLGDHEAGASGRPRCPRRCIGETVVLDLGDHPLDALSQRVSDAFE